MDGMTRVVDVDHSSVQGSRHHDVQQLADIGAFDELVVIGQCSAKAGGETGIRLQDRETGQWYSFWRRPPDENDLRKCEDVGLGLWAASRRCW